MKQYITEETDIQDKLDKLLSKWKNVVPIDPKRRTAKKMLVQLDKDYKNYKKGMKSIEDKLDKITKDWGK